jgi:broad specificity phosphatase PhoE
MYIFTEKTGGCMRDIYLVRHGYYVRDDDTGEQVLTDVGRIQAEAASVKLKEAGLGETAVLLTSTQPRAVQTAEIIGENLRLEPLGSARLAMAGEHTVPGGTKLGDVIQRCFHELDIEPPEEAPIIAVTHAPLIEDVLANLEDAQTKRAFNGGVYKADSESIIGREQPEAIAGDTDFTFTPAPRSSYDFAQEQIALSRQDYVILGGAAVALGVVAYMAWKKGQ